MKYLFALFALSGIFIFSSASRVAAVEVFPDDVCSRAPNSTVCQGKDTVSGYDPDDPTNSRNPLFGTNGVLTTVINIISMLVAIAAVVSIMVAGFKYITSGSNPQEVTNARELVLYAVIALFIVALSQILVRFFLNKVFG